MMSFMQSNGRGQTVSFGSGGIFINGKRIEKAEMEQPETVKLVIDGTVVWEGKAKVAELHIEGSASVETCDAEVHIKGDARGPVKTMSGSVHVEGNVLGGASTMSGDVRVAGEIRGGVSTMSGDIHKGGERKKRRA